jgi:hypothetical protein
LCEGPLLFFKRKKTRDLPSKLFIEVNGEELWVAEVKVFLMNLNFRGKVFLKDCEDFP